MTTRDGSRPVHVLVLAKAPVAGRVKTRLGVEVGMTEAAEVAAAALLDTVRAAAEAVGPHRCHLVLEGDLADAVRGAELTAALAGWTVVAQRGDDLGERIAAAHADVTVGGGDNGAGQNGGGAARGSHGEQEGITVQIGMDTPQVTPQALLEAAQAVATGPYDAALGPAEDGGWWVLALRHPARAAALDGVPMSTPTTYDDTAAALVAAGSSVAGLGLLSDVDTVEDAETVAAAIAPTSEFARTWSALTVVSGATR